MTVHTAPTDGGEQPDIIEYGWRRHRGSAPTGAGPQQTLAESAPVPITIDDTSTIDAAAATRLSATDPGLHDRSIVRRLRPMRRVGEPLLLIGIAFVAFVVTGLRGGSPIPDSGPGVSATSDPAVVSAARPWTPNPRFIAPATARPGEHLTVVAFHSREACGDPVLRFDDNPVMHQLSSYIASPDPAWIGMFMTLDLPATTPVGIHEIELYVPHDGGIRGPMCGNEPHPVRLGSATVTVTL